MTRDFHQGLTFWWRGWGHILNHRRLFVLAVIPTLLSCLFTVAFLWLLWNHLGIWVQTFILMTVGLAPGVLYDLVYYPLVVGGGLIVFLAALYFIFVLQAFVAIPFYSALADKTLAQLGKARPSPGLGGTLRLFRVGAVKGIFLLLIGLLLFVFSFVPVLNVIAIICTLMILAFDCIDYSFDGVGLGFRGRWRYLFSHRAQWLGMAAGLALTLLLPGLTLLVTPGAVVGGALILKENEIE